MWHQHYLCIYYIISIVLLSPGHRLPRDLWIRGCCLLCLSPGASVLPTSTAGQVVPYGCMEQSSYFSIQEIQWRGAIYIEPGAVRGQKVKAQGAIAI